MKRYADPAPARQAANVKWFNKATGCAAEDGREPLTRAQVKAELVQLERAAYSPSMDRVTYLAEIRAAEAKVAAQNGQTSYGGVADTASASGAPAHTGDSSAPDYFGHCSPDGELRGSCSKNWPVWWYRRRPVCLIAPPPPA
ncbi:DUF4148 domain-containing protein [Caballeronia sp. LZ003]|uniref:DUF4148 domain-containing protein n=1 Tax=unclassified Caballeronia TaxID=2646786 RepID=UPI00285896AC|nr:DUF4148 domain-containing protein [Caballeronia sp. LZ001]